MKAVILLLLTPALACSAVLAHGVYQVPPGEWRSLHFSVTEIPSRVECRFEVLSQPGAARAVLLLREDLERFAGHQPYGYVAATGEQSRGAFEVDVRQTGDFAVLLINSSANRAASSPIQFFLGLGPVPPPAKPAAAFLSRRRKLATIAISLGAFFLLLAGSLWGLLRGMRRAGLTQ